MKYLPNIRKKTIPIDILCRLEVEGKIRTRKIMSRLLKQRIANTLKAT